MSSSTSTSHISPSIDPLSFPCPPFPPGVKDPPHPSHLGNATVHGFLEIPVKMFPNAEIRWHFSKNKKAEDHVPF